MLRLTLSIAAIALAGPALAQTAPDAAAAPAPAAATPAKPNVIAGAQVVDASGAPVGTIESVANGIATLSTGTTKAGIPVGSFAQGDGKLVLGLTKAQVDAQGAPIAATASATPAGTAATTAAAATTAPATIAVGTAVKDQTGATVGTVKAVNGDLITVASATASAQLPRKSFAQSGDSLVIGLTAAQFETAAKAAGGAKKG
ncbi:hypothetical protein FHS31_001262 [Sphingomonas vulcanisoli]|uniref:PRC-barrel domain-containing protein n=1 Tax=Sphingomonas vulcanisoli TaxID=1658060 RepID=A0ABX0TQ58_9SPHN|nr:hypothetical protein [Sphingomonas vulcanisoli]NIJ07666.1 hypothetical protein [Sphingomonas vulcanisoli]